MNIKRILTLALCAAFAILATPAADAVTTATGTITVKWNTQAIGSITLASDYNAGGVGGFTSSTPGVVFTAANGGTGTCTAAPGIPVNDTTNDFGNVTPDAVQSTDCLYKNGANAKVITSDSGGYAVAIAAVVPASFFLCLLPNGAYANNGAVTVSARAAAVAGIVSNATCTGAPGAGFNMAASANLISTAAATAGTNLGGDINLAMAPNAPSGAQSIVVTYTLTMN
jgi:hypothetical protein